MDRWSTPDCIRCCVYSGARVMVWTVGPGEMLITFQTVGVATYTHALRNPISELMEYPGVADQDLGRQISTEW